MSAIRVAGGEDGCTPKTPYVAGIDAGVRLCCAASQGNVAAVRELCYARADINAADYDGRTALHVASSKGRVEMVQLLMELGADVEKKDNFGMTAVLEAQRTGKMELAKLLRGKADNEAELQELQASSAFGMWAIPASEVELGSVLSTTIKSVIYIAHWRGTKVVAKTTTSSTSIAGLGSEDTVDVVARKEVYHEIKLLSTMRHPDLVMFLGACLDGPRPFFVTEFMEGGDLDSFYTMKARKLGHPFRPNMSTFMRWASSVARALSFLHNCTQPIIHRDLKPLNLLLDASYTLKVTDFGISKLMAPKAKVDETPAPYMSGGVGTWRYMAPEVVRYKQYTDRVDIYSFALVMWFMSTGQEPFVEQFGRDAEAVLKAYIKGQEPRPDTSASGSRLGPAIPKVLHQFLKDCWHVVPEERPSSLECTQQLAKLSASASSPSAMQAFANFFGAN